MNRNRTNTKKGFSLVELLAVVLILSVLAAVAVPLYLNSRKTSAARTCSSNITAIAAAESAYSTRFGSYVSGGSTWASAYTAASGTAPGGGLIGAPEGLALAPTCPLTGLAYTVTAASTGGGITIACPSVASHTADTGTTDTTPWTKVMSASGNDNSNKL